MAFLREQNSWPESIYLIERHDPLMGGEYGIANVPPRQLADRTVWLLKRFLAEHDEHGHHFLDEKAVAANAGITEDKLNLDKSILEMVHQTNNLDGELTNLLKSMQFALDSDQSIYGPLYMALLINWKFGYPRFAFELFNPTFTLVNDFIDVPLIESIKGDDSIDVEDSSQLVPDDSYILFDEKENRSTFVTVKKVLTHKRVILYHDEQITRGGTGILTKLNWRHGQACMNAKAGTSYISREIDVLNGAGVGELAIAHRSPASFSVEIKRQNQHDKTAWERVPSTEKIFSENLNLWRTIFEVPGCTFTFRVTAETDAEIEHMAIYSSIPDKTLSPIRTPQVVDNDFTITRYGAIYKIPHAKTKFDISPVCDFSKGFSTYTFPTENNPLPIWDFRSRILERVDQPLIDCWWRARYVAENGIESHNSNAGHFVMEKN